jgi:hypothetical protein
VVLIVGPRRAGKTTLVRKMGEARRTYITLDDQTVLEAAQSDPAGFIRGLDRAIIDEIQRVPDLLLAIKKTVDEDYRPGRFLLTGSANVLTLPRISDSLAGRMAAARDRGCHLEINAEPDRLDLDDVHAFAAREAGVKLAVSTDAHTREAFGLMRFGIDQARRGWLGPADTSSTPASWRSCGSS